MFAAPLTRRLRVAAAGAVIAAALAAPAAAQPSHPLDALQPDEYAAMRAALEEAGHLSENSLFADVRLNPPPKAEVLAWEEGDPIPRQAFAVVREGDRTFEAVVDVAEGEVVSWQEMEGAEPGVLLSEWEAAQAITQSDDGWLAAMAERGYDDIEEGDFFCAPLTAGYLGIEQFEGKRILNVQCFDVRDAKTNMYGKPIGGLTAVVDLNAEEVIHIYDDGPVPTPESTSDYDEGSVGELLPERKPTVVEQPEGANFTIDGSMISWRAWQFHVRLDRRMGTVISLARFDDGGDERMVMYQGALSEIFVPYMDPSAGWRYKTYMDAGEYGFGLFATPLQRGTDCPANAAYLSGHVAFDGGEAIPMENVICVFERNAGNPHWRHSEFLNETHESRAQVDLVVRMIGTVGNYDYILDWTFTEGGEIVVNVGSTGIDIPKAVETESMDDPTAEADTRYGTLGAPNIALPFHDHYFNFRLDLDVDGQSNRFVKDVLTRETLPEDNPRRSLWTIESEVADTESQGKMRIDLQNPVQWRVANPGKENALGAPVGYVLKPGFNIYSLMAENDLPQQRAQFIENHLWVTPYEPDEMFAAGDYVNRSKGGGGLPSWTSADRSIEDRDIVLWYTLGTHHVTQPEDWPVLPTKWHSFRLVPFNFFDRSPVIALPDQRFGVEDE